MPKSNVSREKRGAPKSGRMKAKQIDEKRRLRRGRIEAQMAAPAAPAAPAPQALEGLTPQTE